MLASLREGLDRMAGRRKAPASPPVPDMSGVVVSHERKRGCGYRSPGKTGMGIYLVGSADSEWARCSRLPWPLIACDACGQGIRRARGATWIKPPAILGPEIAGTMCGLERCVSCSFGGKLPERALLLWVGKNFYPTAREFIDEEHFMGLSRRLSAMPRDFIPGETRVFLAHPDAVLPWNAHYRHDLDASQDAAVEVETEIGLTTVELPQPPTPPRAQPGIFMSFVPNIDLVIDPAKGVPKRARELQEKWPDRVRLVRVEPIPEPVDVQRELPL